MVTLNEIHKKVKKRQIAPLYLLYGQEEFLLDETIKLIINTVLAPEEKEFNLSVFDMNEVTIDVALEDAETLPFIGEKRVVLIKDPIFLTGQKEKNKIDHDLKRLEEYLESPSPDSVVIFTGHYDKVDERKKLVKLLKKNGEVFQASFMDDKAINAWIKNRVTAENMDIDDEAIELLLRLVGPKLLLLANEIEKLMLYVGKDGKINQPAIRNLVPRTLEQNVFSLVDMIVKRKTEEALLFYYDLLEQKEEPIKILSLVAAQFRLIYQVKELYKRGYGQNQTATYLKVHPFRVKLAGEQATRFSEAELQKIIANLAEIDYKMKTGKMDKKLLLELFILQLNG
ncbi:MAG TPA: DNA polymerase III subunit delta [Bacillus bacterium]|nr:DNA polymerase III subunit delta [Bacillus sp. (in: firmicutes)]